MMLFRHACILGPGLLGASLLQALRQERLAERLTAWARRPETRIACEGQWWCDAVAPTPAEAVEGADLVVLCTPVESIVSLLEEIAQHCPDGCLVTDVGSTKSLICRHGRAAFTSAAVPKVPQNAAAEPPATPETADGLSSAQLSPANGDEGRGPAVFIGSHPMAGSEKGGWQHARPDLFHRHPCFVTPVPGDDPRAVERVTRLWSRLGMQVTTTSPEKHDETVAQISHLPHFLASLLCCFLDGQRADSRPFAGNGLRDTTRIASGDPALWRAIAEHNHEEISTALGGFADHLHELRSALENQDFAYVERVLARGKHFRDGLF